MCTPLLQIVLLTSNIIIVSQEQQVWTWERKQSSNMARFSASCGTFDFETLVHPVGPLRHKFSGSFGTLET